MTPPLGAHFPSQLLSFGRASIWTILLATIMTGSSLGARSLLASSGVAPEIIGIISGFIAAAVAVVMTLAIEIRETPAPILTALRALGLKSARSIQIKLALLGMVPIIVGYLIIFYGIGKSPALEPNAGLMLIKFILSQGIGEEVVFRGFIFRRLRQGRSFWSAASLSAILFSLIHLVNFAKGVSPEIMMAVTVSVIFSFILAFPLALLFEVGEFSIVGGALWHVAIDSVNWFKEAGEPGAAMNIYLVSVLAAAGVVTAATLKYRLPPPHRPL